MHPDAYRRFTAELVTWASQAPDVTGLVAVGSTAGVTHHPDEWSDHDVFVVTRPGAAATLLESPAWLPDPDRIVLWHDETVDGRAAVYDDGHLVELAVFEDGAIPSLGINDHRVLVGPPSLSGTLVALRRATACRASADDAAGTRRFGQIVVQLLIGLGRGARGETLSAHERIRGQALTHLLSLVRDFRSPETEALLDNLDPYRRVEQSHPTVARRLTEALDGPIPLVVGAILGVLEDELAEVVPAFSPDALAAVRVLASRN